MKVPRVRADSRQEASVRPGQAKRRKIRALRPAWGNYTASALEQPPENGNIAPVSRLRARVVSSAVEHCSHTAGVAGSNPVPPTNNQRLTLQQGFHTEIIRNVTLYP